MKITFRAEDNVDIAPEVYNFSGRFVDPCDRSDCCFSIDSSFKGTVPDRTIVHTGNSANIFTSGTILTCAGFLIGEIASDPTVASIGVALERGTLISIILVLFVLPQILLFGDFIIEKTALVMNISRPQKEVVGRVRVTGHVKGYVQGEIDADVSGVFQGQMKVSLDSHIPGRHGEVTHDDTQNPMLPGMTQDENVAAESETAAKEEQEEKKS